ncbi:MAG: hypothetical protein LBR79_03480 [Oscillospiraceae bacterium]|jgi:hypothetical protein|nr:hypothetical protein [Oscillospiraceae bacterium]
MNEKAKEKLKDKNFLKKIIGLKTKDEVMDAFSSEEVEISEKEIEEIGEYVNTIVGKLSEMPEDDLQKISGGVCAMERLGNILLAPIRIADDFLEPSGNAMWGTLMAVFFIESVLAYESGKFIYKKAKEAAWWAKCKGAAAGAKNKLFGNK